MDKKKKLLSEQRVASFKSGDSPFALHAVYLLLLHPEKGIYLAQRANKREDPNLWSTTVGGHVSADEQPDQTVIRESQEELNIKLIIAPTIDDYVLLAQQESFMERAVARKVDFIPWLGTYRLDRVTKDHWLKRTHGHFYAGVFRGSLVLSSEVRDCRPYTKNELHQQLSEHNRLFSDTLRVLVERYPATLGNV